MTLPKDQARLRVDVTKALGRAMNRVDAAFRHVLHNRRAAAYGSIDATFRALDMASRALYDWSEAAEAARPRKARKR